MEALGGAEIYLKPVEETHYGAGRCLKEGCEPVGSPCWSRLFLKDCTPWKGPMLEQFMKNCNLWERLMLEKFVEDWLLWEGPHTEDGERLLSLRGKQQQKQRVMN
ncbi:hypothetical protein HGM15179_013468 [Zosterops borbonicus]|uniref:Uncharacterized protein n=1 Tax=Zosterops borbonicus TaxID=364589 RepID=A0A8K1LH46_9PASS|nr:hypothetical protein HGM15179_013468 [Zosterops borbonicus]